MALPNLNNDQQINLDDANLGQSKQSIISALIRSGKMSLSNYGNINFNQNVSVQSATRETSDKSSFLGEPFLRALQEIKSSISDLNSSILRYIESSTIERQVTQNFLEAALEGKEMETGAAKSRTDYDFDAPFSKMNDYLKGIYENTLTLSEGSQKGFVDSILDRISDILKVGGVGAALSYGAHKIYKSISGPGETPPEEGKKEEPSFFDKASEYGKEAFQSAKGFLGIGDETSNVSGSLMTTASAFEGKDEVVNQTELNKFLQSNLGKEFSVSEAWCASFVSAVLSKNGYKPPPSPKSAKSYLNYGEEIAIQNAKPGDIAIFNRGKDRSKGHVGFFVSHSGMTITILGGNQSNSVSKQTREINAEDNELVQIRRPTENEKAMATKEMSLPGQETAQQTSQEPNLNFDAQETAAKEASTQEYPEYEDEIEEVNETVQRETSSPKPQSTTKEGSSSGKVSPKEVYDYLQSKGVGHEHAIGIIANIKAESGFEYGVKQKGGGPGVGLFQYSEPSRKKKFLSAVPDWQEDWKKQIDYALTDKEGGSNKYLSSSYESGEEATAAWTNLFEKPKDKNASNVRKKYVADIEQQVGETTQVAATGGAVKQAAKATEKEAGTLEKVGKYMTEATENMLTGPSNMFSAFNFDEMDGQQFIKGSVGTISKLFMPSFDPRTIRKTPKEKQKIEQTAKQEENLTGQKIEQTAKQEENLTGQKIEQTAKQEESDSVLKQITDFFSPEPNISKKTASLYTQPSEQTVRMNSAQGELNKTIQQNREQQKESSQSNQQPIIVNNSSTQSSGNESIENTGTPNNFNVRDPAIFQLLFESIHTNATIS